ncbi:MAG: M20/M25/M40 family metallo-hydrolase [Eubacteriales bacterium]|nr:M20/M25/M40 family metallo-hydrolase [Eubacteriales bacterium]
MYGEYSQMVDNWKKIIDYGPRPIGSENLEKCSDYVLGVMKEITPYASKDEYPYDAWDVDGFKLEEIREDGNREIEAYVFLNSGSSEGFRGTVKYAGHNRVWDMYVWDRYMIVNDQGEIAAYVTIRTNDEAIPQMLFQGRSDVPHFLVGESERAFFEQAEKEHTLIGGYANTFIKKGTACRNVVGILPNDKPKVVICGHYDTVYSTQGAYDNSAGAAVVLELGRRLRKYRLNYEIELLITDGEEFDLVGSRKRCEKTKEEDIRFVLNVDGVGRDKILEVWSGPESTERKIRKILNQSGEKFGSIYKCPPPPGSDHAPYFAAGIPVCMLTFNDQGILHSPKDTFRESLIENMEVMVRISLDLLEQLKIIEK